MDIRFSATAARALVRSNKRDLIRAKISELAEEPLTQSANVKRLLGRPEYRLRVQDWRVIFRIENGLLWIDDVARGDRCIGENMTVQIVEIAGQKMAVLPIADYERLVDVVEDRLDTASAVTSEQRRADGETYLPAELVDQILNGESALKVWRKFRGHTQEQLACRAGLHKMTVSTLELGKREGSARQWRALAHALGAVPDDIMPIF